MSVLLDTWKNGPRARVESVGTVRHLEKWSQGLGRECRCVVTVDVDVVDVSQTFEKDLSAGLKKTCIESQQLMPRLKRCEGHEAIKTGPSIQDMQKVLNTAYMPFKIIAKVICWKSMNS